MDYGITAQEKGDSVYYSVQWSPLELAERWTINSKVPAVGGYTKSTGWMITIICACWR